MKKQNLDKLRRKAIFKKSKNRGFPTENRSIKENGQ